MALQLFLKKKQPSPPWPACDFRRRPSALCNLNCKMATRPLCCVLVTQRRVVSSRKCRAWRVTACLSCCFSNPLYSERGASQNKRIMRFSFKFKKLSFPLMMTIRATACSGVREGWQRRQGPQHHSVKMHIFSAAVA